MSSEAKQSHRLSARAVNFPNVVTGLRLVLSVFLFCCLAWDSYLAGMVLFIVAAGTDWLDGYYARKYRQITTLGRILDPFADKVVVCGTFIFVAAVPAMANAPWGLRPWMVVVIVGRELLVTALRTFIEERGADFSANLSGKLKMVFQCVAAPGCLCYLAYELPASHAPYWCWLLMVGSVWAAVVLTVYSGLVYIQAAIRLLRS